MESSEECWSAEQLRAAEAQIEEQKRAWELKRLAALSGNDDERNLNESDPDALLTYSHQDAANQVKRKPGKPRNVKSKLSQATANHSPDPSSNSTVAGGKRRRRQNVTNPEKTTPVETAETTVVVAKNEPDKCPLTVSTPPPSQQPRRKRIRAARSEPTTPDGTLDESDSQSHNASPVPTMGDGSKTLSPRTRSRGTVNINLWTLDAKPLIPPARASPSPKLTSNKAKDGCCNSPSPTVSETYSNGCTEPATDGGLAVPVKKAKLAAAGDAAEPDLDLDVVS